jgi:hypothetical protein
MFVPPFGEMSDPWDSPYDILWKASEKKNNVPFSSWAEYDDFITSFITKSDRLGWIQKDLYYTSFGFYGSFDTVKERLELMWFIACKPTFSRESK